MKFAFIIMGDFDEKKDRAYIHHGQEQIVGVPNLTQACKTAKELWEDGIECIELCGAFGENGAEEVINATQNKIPIGYTIHLPKQDEIFKMVFDD